MTDHRLYLQLQLGSKRSDVFKELGLAVEPRFRLGSLIGKPSYDGWHLDEGPGSYDFLVVSALPTLDMRTSDGVEIFFDTRYRLRSLWFEHPFSLPVHGITFGMTPSEVHNLHGKAIESILDLENLCYSKFDLGQSRWLNVEFTDGHANVISIGLPETV